MQDQDLLDILEILSTMQEALESVIFPTSTAGRKLEITRTMLSTMKAEVETRYFERA